MRFLVSILEVYEMILLARFIFSFFLTSRWLHHPIYQMLYVATDPYLRLFRFEFLRWNSWDFSPILAIWFLGLLKAIFTGQITTISMLLIYLLFGAWELIRLAGIVLVIILGFRLISATFFHQFYPSLSYFSLDRILSRISFGICRIFFKKGFMTYIQSLAWSFAILVALGVILSYTVSWGIFALRSLPF